MGRKVLPCPVCGGESFLESVTQGGLICSDCGAVSNQVEVADEEDPGTVTRTYMTGLQHRHVTPEEAKLRRERRGFRGLVDNRNFLCLLRGLGLTLDGMIDSCISTGLCPPEAKDITADLWMEFVTTIGERTDDPIIFTKSPSLKFAFRMAQWGIHEDLLELVSKYLYKSRIDRNRQLRQLVKERRIELPLSAGLANLASSIYAHDWLCNFLNSREFPLSDSVLVSLAASNCSLSCIRQIQAGSSPSPDATPSLSLSDRRFLITKIFVDIIKNTEIRDSSVVNPTKRNVSTVVPAIDSRSLLAVLVTALRRSGVGVQPVHVLNWIAKGLLPYFSAHKSLPSSIDRIEYYKVGRTAWGYKRSHFGASRAPSVKELEGILQQIQGIGIETRITKHETMIMPILQFLGLGRLRELCEELYSGVQRAQARGRPVFKIVHRDYRRLVSLSDKAIIPEGDLKPELIIAMTIVIAMKLSFPELHDPNADSVKVEPVYADWLPKEGELEYKIVSNRYPSLFDNDYVGSVDWWNELKVDERNQFLQFAESELFNELRGSLAEEARLSLSGNQSIPPSFEDPDVYVLRSRPINTYSIFSERAARDESCLLSYVLKDVANACQIEPDAAYLAALLRQLESYIFIMKR